MKALNLKVWPHPSPDGSGRKPRQHMALGMIFRLVVTGLCLLGITGCVSYPISKPLRQRAQSTKAVNFLTIWQDPNAYMGQMVIWGGKILKTVNQTNGGSVYVLQSPLDDQERPESTKLSQGRFIVRSPGFLDPEVYRVGARITIAGELTGSEAENIGKTSYFYPVVTLQEVYFWRHERTVYVTPPAGWWGWYGPYWPYDDDFYDGYYYYPRYYYRDFHHYRGRYFDRSRREGGGEHDRR
jgi:outer membrane lipoprotein